MRGQKTSKLFVGRPLVAVAKGRISVRELSVLVGTEGSGFSHTARRPPAQSGKTNLQGSIWSFAADVLWEDREENV